MPPNPATHANVISQPGVRIGVRTSDLIRVTFAQLAGAGFNTSGDNSLWQLYESGNEQAIKIGAGYIEFLGKAVDTRETDMRMYYLVSGTSAGKRIPLTTLSLPQNPGSFVEDSTFDQTYVRKERTSYNAEILNGEADNFFGRAVISSVPTTATFALTGVDKQAAGTRRMRVRFQGFSFTNHQVQLTLNGNVLNPATGVGRQQFQTEYDIPVSFLLEGTNTLTMQSSTSGDSSLVDTLEIDFPKNFVAESNRLNFYTDSNKITTLSGFSSSSVRVFDVSVDGSPKEYSVPLKKQGNKFFPQIPPASASIYYAVESSTFSAPFSVTANDTNSLKSVSNAGTFLVVAHPSLKVPAQKWADYRSAQGVASKVVLVDEIYDEFSYGSESSYAIEDFLNFAKNNWSAPPEYLLLVGDASTNARNYANSSGTQPGYWNMVPSRMLDTLFRETGSDEALADFNSDGLSEIPVGRIASRDTAGVEAALEKTKTWENSLTSTSMSRGALFAIDTPGPDGYNFQNMSTRIMSNLPADMPKTEVLRGTANDQGRIMNAINSGAFVANYSGHGTAAAWQNSAFFSKDQVPQLTNSSNPTLFLALTCLNGYFMGNVDTLAEGLTNTPGKGGVAVWASTGLTTPDVQEIMANRFYQKLSEGQITRLGNLVSDAKAQLNGGQDVRLSWALIGDPMLKVR